MKINNNITGIYRITNTITGKHYIGSAINIRLRWKAHRRKLRRGDHDSKHLQSSFNKWGLRVFEFVVIEKVEDLNKLLEYEQKFLDFYKSYDRLYGYNTLKVAGSNWMNPASDETREKLRLSHLGHKRSKEAMDQILKSMYKKVYQIDKDTLLILNSFESIKEASKITGISAQNISGVCRRRNKTAKGYYWSFDSENFTPLERTCNTPLQIRYIVCPTTNRRWKTIIDASVELGLTKNQIYSKITWKELKYEYEYRI